MIDCNTLFQKEKNKKHNSVLNNFSFINSFKKFLFPLHPYSFFSSVNHITFLAFLFSLSLLFKFFSIIFAGSLIKISFDSIPIIFSGIFFGPLISVFLAIFSDFIGWLFFYSNQPFFLLFTVQTILIAIISSCFSLRFSYFFKLKIQDQKKFRFFLNWTLFFLLSVFLIRNSFVLKEIWLINLFLISCLFLFFLLNDLFVYFSKFFLKENQQIIFIYVNTLLLFIVSICSFLMGPIIVNLYFQKFEIFINNFFIFDYFSNVSNQFEFKYSFFLFWRILKEILKFPIAVFLLTKIIFMFVHYSKTDALLLLSEKKNNIF